MKAEAMYGTLLSIDIKGSTLLIRGMDVEEAGAVLGKCTSIMVDVVEFFRGEVLETAGDGIIAYFKSTAEFPNSVEASIIAAHMMQEYVQDAMPNVHTRVGLHQIAEAPTRTSTMYCKQVESYADTDGIQLSEAFYQIIDGVISVTKTHRDLITYKLIEFSSQLTEKITRLKIRYVEAQEKLAKEETNQVVTGERKVITIIFIKSNYTKLQNDICNEIENSGGTVLKVTFETVVAIFGAPKAFEDHASRACKAALVIKAIISEHHKNPKFTIGIHSGEAVVDLVGGSSSKQYDALGAPVSLAARMQQSADNCEINVSHLTYSLVKNNFNLIEIGSIELKGFEKPIDTFRLQSEKTYAQKTRELSTPHSATPMIGRKNEIKNFKNILKLAKSGQGQVVEVSCQAGGGKSRLIYEFEKILEEQNVANVQASCFPASQTTPLYPILHLMETILDIEENLSRDMLAEQISAHLKKHRIKGDHIEDSFFYLFNLPVTDESWLNMDASTKFQYLYQTIYTFLHQTYKDSVVFIAFEDLHWADAQSIDCISYLVRRIEQDRIIIGLDYRPEEFARERLPTLSYSNIMNIAALNSKDSMSLLNYLLPHDESVAELIKTIVTRCEGNPFFLKETVKNLIEDEVVVKVDNQYQLTEKGVSYVLPDSVRTLLNSRIDRLPTTEKKALQAASIIGRVFAKPMLIMIEKDIDEKILIILMQKEFIFEIQGRSEAVEFEFNHALTRDAVYFDMLKSKREYYHSQLAKQLETYFKNDIDKYSSLIAEHADKGKLYEMAFSYYHQIGPKMFNMGLHREALAALFSAERCFKLIDQPTKELLIRYIYNESYLMHIKPMVGQTSVYSGEKERKIIDIAKEYTDDETLSLLYISLSIEYSNNSYVTESERVLDKAKPLVQKVNKEELKNYYAFFLQYVYQLSGRYLECEKTSDILFSQNKPFNYFAHQTPVISGSYYHQSYAYADQGKYDKCYDMIHTVREIEKNTNITNFTTLFLSICHFVPDVIFGNFEDLLKSSEYATRRYKTMMYGLPTIILGPCMAMCEVLYKNDSMYKNLDASYEFYSAMPSYVYKVAYSATWLAEACLIYAMNNNQQKLERAKVILEKIAVFCTNGETKPVVARYLKLQAMYLLVEKSQNKYIETAAELLHKALKIAQSIDMHTEVAYITAELALYYRIFQKDEILAKTHYNEALTMFKNMKMNFWAEYLTKRYTV